MSEVWGTGYGSQRHLVAEDTRRQLTRRHGNSYSAQAQCSSAVYLTFLSDSPVEAERREVARKQPCSRCLKKSQHQPCPTCAGTGVVTPTENEEK